MSHSVDALAAGEDFQACTHPNCLMVTGRWFTASTPIGYSARTTRCGPRPDSTIAPVLGEASEPHPYTLSAFSNQPIFELDEVAEIDVVVASSSHWRRPGWPPSSPTTSPPRAAHRPLVSAAAEAFEDAGQRYDVVIDTVGGKTGERAFTMVRPGAVTLSAPPPAGIADEFGLSATFFAWYPIATSSSSWPNWSTAPPYRWPSPTPWPRHNQTRL